MNEWIKQTSRFELVSESKWVRVSSESLKKMNEGKTERKKNGSIASIKRTHYSRRTTENYWTRLGFSRTRHVSIISSFSCRWTRQGSSVMTDWDCCCCLLWSLKIQMLLKIIAKNPHQKMFVMLGYEIGSCQVGTRHLRGRNSYYPLLPPNLPNEEINKGDVKFQHARAFGAPRKNKNIWVRMLLVPVLIPLFL